MLAERVLDQRALVACLGARVQVGVLGFAIGRLLGEIEEVVLEVIEHRGKRGGHAVARERAASCDDVGRFLQ